MCSARYSAGLSIALASTLASGGHALASENCLFQLSPPEESVVLGSSVTPQANYLVVDTCGKSAEVIRAELLSPAQKQALAALEERERVMRIREEGDRLTRLRDESRKAAAKQEAEGGWFSWLWRSGDGT
jgi:hypothetical protein